MITIKQEKHINVLDPSVANKIAAGEVVERPASIVKELVENSLDAGATAVTIEIRGGGIDYIRITDNGCGIPESEVPKAFLRHATSKLSKVEDLSSISSFGFRGEALASIAAVSKVSMRTRTEDGDCGTHIVINGGVQAVCEPCACPVGTTIEVNELFYNVPARLKFIKNQRTEAAAISDYVSRLMLSNTGVAIKLINNGRTVLSTTGRGDLASAILAVYGSYVFSSLYKIEYDDGYIRIDGYVGGESIARSNRLQQSTFVNGRYIRSAAVSNAVQRAFLTRLMNHRFPFFVINITISSREVDVNVHPNKLTVRFGDEERVMNAVAAAAAKALAGSETVISNEDQTSVERSDADVSVGSQTGKQGNAAVHSNPAGNAAPNGHGSEDHRGRYATEEEIRKIFGRRNGGTEGAETETTYIPDADPSDLPEDHSFSDSGASTMPGFSGIFHGFPSFNVGQKAETPESTGPSCAESEPSPIPEYDVGHSTTTPAFAERAEQTALDTDKCRIIGTAFDTYIIVQQGEAIYYIDQHAAHERMLYEKLISGSLKFDSQLMAIPMIVSLDPISFNCVAENIERFEEFGYSLDLSEPPIVRVDAVPNLPEARSMRFLRDVIDCVLENKDCGEKDIMRSRIIRMSCKRAVKGGDSLEIRQLEEIVRAYTGNNVPLTCPHGRPVLIRITKTDLEKMFKRII